ncbi:MAG: hypothetical protein AAF532_00315 [Planctomycetota bacterium]
MNSDAWKLVLTGLSLTCVTSATLFFLVSVNPKDESYGTAPLIYAGLSIVGAIAFNRAAAFLPADGERPTA